MSKAFKSKRISSLFGIFFQIPVFLVAAFGLFKLFEMFYYSFTYYNMLEKPSFIGFTNYSNIFKNEVVCKSLGNTILMVCIVAVLLLFTAVLPAVFTSRLKLPFGLAIMGAFSVISICAMLTNGFNIIFSGDSLGILNSLALNAEIINEPIQFTQTHAMALSVIAMWLLNLAPVFLITYIAARMKHSFLGAAIAVCAIPVLMFAVGGVVTGIVGFPSVNYSADWIYTAFTDYLTVRYDVGFAYAILTVGFMILIAWCAVACTVTFGLWALFKNANSRFTAFKATGYITFGVSILLFAAVLFFVIIYLLKAFMPLEELFVFPPNLIPQKPVTDNFSNLAELASNSSVPLSRFIINSLVNIPLRIILLCIFVALPSGVGFGAFKMFKRQKLSLLCFIPLLFVLGYITLSKSGLLDTYFVYMAQFISSFEFLIAVFLVYLAVRLVMYRGKPQTSGILLGSFFVLTSFYAIGAIRGIWYTGNGMVYAENLKTWKDLTAALGSGGMARCGIAAANDMLMLLATLAVVIIPLVLLFLLYRLYRKNIKMEMENNINF